MRRVRNFASAIAEVQPPRHPNHNESIRGYNMRIMIERVREVVPDAIRITKRLQINLGLVAIG